MRFFKKPSRESTARLAKNLICMPRAVSRETRLIPSADRGKVIVDKLKSGQQELKQAKVHRLALFGGKESVVLYLRQLERKNNRDELSDIFLKINEEKTKFNDSLSYPTTIRSYPFLTFFCLARSGERVESPKFSEEDGKQDIPSINELGRGCGYKEILDDGLVKKCRSVMRDVDDETTLLDRAVTMLVDETPYFLPHQDFAMDLFLLGQVVREEGSSYCNKNRSNRPGARVY